MQPRNGSLKKILPTMFLSAAALAVAISFLGFVAWMYQNGHKGGTFVARESFVLDLDISCENAQCAPSHLHIDRASFDGRTGASGKAETAGVLATVSLEDGGRIGEMQVSVRKAEGACHDKAESAYETNIPKESWVLTRDASVFNSDITMSAPAACGKQGGNVHVRLHSSMLPRDF